MTSGTKDAQAFSCFRAAPIVFTPLAWRISIAFVYILRILDTLTAATCSAVLEMALIRINLESARLANQRALRHRSPLPRSLDSLEAVNHLALPGPNQSPDTSMIPYVFPQQTATFQNQVQDSLMSDRYVSAWQFMITTGFYPAVLAPDGFPIPREVPNVIYPPQDSYPVIEDSSFVVKID